MHHTAIYTPQTHTLHNNCAHHTPHTHDYTETHLLTTTYRTYTLPHKNTPLTLHNGHMHPCHICACIHISQSTLQSQASYIHTHAMHTSNPHNKYIHATHFTYQSHASQIHLCYIHNPTAPSLVTFPLSKLGLQPQAEKGRVTQAMPRGLVALARMCAPGAALGAGDSPGGAHVCLVCTCACPQEPMCPDTLGMCV